VEQKGAVHQGVIRHLEQRWVNATEPCRAREGLLLTIWRAGQGLSMSLHDIPCEVRICLAPVTCLQYIQFSFFLGTRI
jgi:hypothetical protein